MSIVSPDGNSSYLLFGSPSRTGQYNAIVYSGYGGGSEYLAMNTYQGGEVMRLTHQGNVGIGPRVLIILLRLLKMVISKCYFMVEEVVDSMQL